jgi:hypothetical protein
MVLAFSAIEELGQEERWTSEQRALIQATAAELENRATTPDEHEVAEAVRRLHRLSLRQGVMRVLARLGLATLKTEWDRLYGIRSGVFHGTSPIGSKELRQAASEAVTLCGKILLEQLRNDGVEPPGVAAVQFN